MKEVRDLYSLLLMSGKSKGWICIALTALAISASAFIPGRDRNILNHRGQGGTEVSFAYDAMNRLSSSTQSVYSVSSVVQNSYDVNGNRTAIAYPGRLNVTYAYDTEDRLSGAVLSGSMLSAPLAFSFAYDNASRLTGITYPNAVAASFAYDAESRVVGFNHGTFLEHSIERDPRGYKTRQDIYTGLVPNFTNSLSRTRTHNDADQLLSSGSDTYAYDANGNMTNSVAGTYVWDYDNRLIATPSVQYLYDASGVRVGRIHDNGQQTTTNFFVVDYSDALKRPLAETDSSGTVTRWYVWAGFRLLAHTEANGTVRVRYYHSDELGSSLAITDETGSVTDQFAYSSYGQLLGRTGSTDTPFQWLGGYGVYYDADADLHLTLYRAYSAEMRRWLSADPMGIDGFENLYAYGDMNPLFFVDPLGLYVLLEAHPVALGFNHSKIVIIPDDQATWRDHPDFLRFLNGEVYMVIGAGSINGKLAADLNRKRDVIRTHNVFSTPVNLPAEITENQYIENLLSTHNNYQNNVNYSLFPLKSSSSYNSNSYISGLINATGGTVSTAPPSAPGYRKPLPSSHFQPQIQSQAPANKSSHILK